MRYFTDSSYEKMMMQRPKAPRGRQPPAPPGGDFCIGCEQYKKGCSGSCNRELIIKKKEDLPCNSYR